MKHQKSYIRDGRAPIPKDEKTSRVMSANNAKNSKPEMLLRKELWNDGLRGYRTNYKKIAGTPDIVFTKYKLAIFVNGCFWHRCPKCNHELPRSNTQFWKDKFDANVNRDKNKIQQLYEGGWDVLVVWECEIKDNIHNIFSMIKETLERKRND